MKRYTKKLLSGITIALFLTGISFVETYAGSDKLIEEQLETAYELHLMGNEQASLSVYRDILSKDDDNLEALWNASLLYAKRGYRSESDELARNDYEKALNLARTAVSDYPDSGHAYYALAVGIGRMSLLEGPGSKVKASREIQKNIEIAIDKIPEFAPVWHLYGVWHSDISNLNGAIKAAATLFGGIPDASSAAAETYLSKAIELDKDNILFHLDFAKHFMKVDQPEKARALLRNIMKIEPQMKDDPAYIDEAREMLQEIV